MFYLLSCDIPGASDSCRSAAHEWVASRPCLCQGSLAFQWLCELLQTLGWWALNSRLSQSQLYELLPLYYLAFLCHIDKGPRDLEWSLVLYCSESPWPFQSCQRDKGLKMTGLGMSVGLLEALLFRRRKSGSWDSRKERNLNWQESPSFEAQYFIETAACSVAQIRFLPLLLYQCSIIQARLESTFLNPSV